MINHAAIRIVTWTSRRLPFEREVCGPRTFPPMEQRAQIAETEVLPPSGTVLRQARRPRPYAPLPRMPRPTAHRAPPNPRFHSAHLRSGEDYVPPPVSKYDLLWEGASRTADRSGVAALPACNHFLPIFVRLIDHSFSYFMYRTTQ